jgi:hypothetical protein
VFDGALLLEGTPSSDKSSELATDPTCDTDLDPVDCDCGVLLPAVTVVVQLTVLGVVFGVRSFIFMYDVSLVSIIFRVSSMQIH